MALPDGISDQEACWAVIEGVRRLAGHQVISFDNACRVCFGFRAGELNREGAKMLQWLLDELGYEQHWVAPLGRLNMQHLWVRRPWPLDFNANLHRDFEAFVSAG